MRKVITKEFVDSLVGLTEAEAEQQIQNKGFCSRVMRRDGRSFMGTCDMRHDRINLSVNNGRVTEADVG